MRTETKDAMTPERAVGLVERVGLLGLIAGFGYGVYWIANRLFFGPKIPIIAPPMQPPVITPNPPVTITQPSGPPIVGPPGGQVITPPTPGIVVPQPGPPAPGPQGPITQYHVIAGPFSDPLQAQLAAEIQAASFVSVAAILQGKLKIVIGLGTDGHYYVMNALQPPP